VKLAGTVITDMNHVKEETARMLYGTFDGNGLSSHVAVPLIHSWVSDGTKITYGSKLAVRGRTSRDPRCSMCKDYEALGHILQTCARTWAQRNERHNTLVDKVVTILKRNKFEVQVKPRIPTSAGVKKPNIVAWLKGYSAVVTDATRFVRASEVQVTLRLFRGCALGQSCYGLSAG